MRPVTHYMELAEEFLALARRHERKSIVERFDRLWTNQLARDEVASADWSWRAAQDCFWTCVSQAVDCEDCDELLEEWAERQIARMSMDVRAIRANVGECGGMEHLLACLPPERRRELEASLRRAGLEIV